MSTGIFVDCETTGDDPETAKVIEFGWKQFEGQLQGCCLYGASDPIKFGALATHNILPEEIAGLDPFTLDSFEFPLDGVDYWIGHNVDFDHECCGKPNVKRICTLAMARRIWPTLDSHRLTALMYFIHGANDITRQKLKRAHSAFDDVLFCESLLMVMMDVTGLSTLEQLHEFSENARVPTIMTFGKFRDQPVSAVDRGYANWYRKQPKPDPYVLEAFRRNGLI